MEAVQNISYHELKGISASLPFEHLKGTWRGRERRLGKSVSCSEMEGEIRMSGQFEVGSSRTSALDSQAQFFKKAFLLASRDHYAHGVGLIDQDGQE